jgi:hypothetical protein
VTETGQTAVYSVRYLFLFRKEEGGRILPLDCILTKNLACVGTGWGLLQRPLDQLVLVL